MIISSLLLSLPPSILPFFFIWAQRGLIHQLRILVTTGIWVCPQQKLFNEAFGCLSFLLCLPETLLSLSRVEGMDNREYKYLLRSISLLL